MKKKLREALYNYSVAFLLLVVLWLTWSGKSVEASQVSPDTDETRLTEGTYSPASRVVRGTNTYSQRNETLNTQSRRGEKVVVYGSGFYDYIYGGKGTDIFIPGPGGGRIYARSTHEGGGKKIFVWNVGDGNNRIHYFNADRQERGDRLSILKFGPGISPENVKSQVSGNDVVLVITVGDSVGSIRFKNGKPDIHWPTHSIRWQMDEIRFADGTVWGWDDALASSLTTGTAESLSAHGIAATFRSYRRGNVERYMNPVRLYLDREILFEEEGFHKREDYDAENWKKYFVDFIRGYQVSIGYRFSSEALEEYVRRWEEQKILARLGLPVRELTDEDVLDRNGFYTEEIQTIRRLWYTYHGRSVEQVKQDKEQARNIILQYWNIPENAPVDQWRECIENREQILLNEKTNVLCEPSHVSMLLYISFFLNDEGAADDAWRYCITALTRNYQEISKALDHTIAMLEGPILRWEDHGVFTSSDAEFNLPTTAIGRIVRSMNLSVLPGGIIRFR